MQLISAIGDARGGTIAAGLRFPAGIAHGPEGCVGVYSPPLPALSLMNPGVLADWLETVLPQWLAGFGVRPDDRGWRFLDLEKFGLDAGYPIAGYIVSAILRAAKAYAPGAKWFLYSEPVSAPWPELAFPPASRLISRGRHGWVGRRGGGACVSPAMYATIGISPTAYGDQCDRLMDEAEGVATDSAPVMPMVSIWHAFSMTPITEPLFRAGLERMQRRGVPAGFLWGYVLDASSVELAQGVVDMIGGVLSPAAATV